LKKELKEKYQKELEKLQKSSTFEQEKEKLDIWYETELTKLRVFEEFKATETEVKPHVVNEQEEKVLDVLKLKLLDNGTQKFILKARNNILPNFRNIARSSGNSNCPFCRRH
jgi:hypothetical protein